MRTFGVHLCCFSQKHRSGVETEIKKGKKVRLKPTSAWTGVYKVTVVEISEDDITVQYEEKDRMVIGGKTDNGQKTFAAMQFNDFIVDEIHTV